jgi:hypothetical protein
MTADSRFRSLWSEDELVPFPKDEWIEGGFPASILPAGDEIPTDVEVVFTTHLTGEIGLYDVIQLTTEDGSLDIPLIVVGAVQDNTDLLYVIDPKTAEVLQLDLSEKDVQGVNSNFRAFVEFLYQFALFVEEDQGKAGRAERAGALQDRLKTIDPNAFQDGAWWPLVFQQLMS